MEEPSFKHFNGVRSKLYIIVFGTDTPAGKLFDVVLLVAILLSIVVVMLESVSALQARFDHVFDLLEWTFTILFSIEYITRIFITRRPEKYVFSFLGLIDLIALLPTYIALFVTGGSYLVVIRAIRLLRVFRILKLTRYLSEAQMLGSALNSSKRKILVFMGAVSTLVMITGTLMYLIEGGQNGFTSIPRSIYWAVVTVTTVGYGDIAPQTVLGQSFATVLMLMGYAIIAVPTGIVSSEMRKMDKRAEIEGSRPCSRCKEMNPKDANYCMKCGNQY
ncbi:ion transporter [Marinoscillum furvescens]|uniref:Voltage-gated potassium channel n=1 Tax=Marinoscillum furvescens DSM 4134 TaxID=1122208 RepID=A0A3D9L724_MARFU|nr:ion transporter [Marinoscillum furvescens]REE01284.1 voltage-gated potassium channel [Marinoscillum furvescens DSM 4134]